MEFLTLPDIAKSISKTQPNWSRLTEKENTEKLLKEIHGGAKNGKLPIYNPVTGELICADDVKKIEISKLWTTKAEAEQFLENKKNTRLEEAIPVAGVPGSNKARYKVIENKPVDWTLWKNMKNVQLWKAACLGCNIDPDLIDYPHLYTYGNIEENVFKLIRLLDSNLNVSHFFTTKTINVRDPHFSEVMLSEFAAWCLDIDWPDLPSKLRGIATQQTEPMTIDAVGSHVATEPASVDISINNSALDVAEDCIGFNELSVWDVALNLSFEKRLSPSKVLKQLAYSALQWIQISTPFYLGRQGNSFLYKDELKIFKKSYEERNYDFLETQFAPTPPEKIDELLLVISARNDEKEYFTEAEVKLLKSVQLYPEHFENWAKRKGMKLPAFWFLNSQAETGLNGDTVHQDSTEPENLEDEAPQGRRDKQIAFICTTANALNYCDLLNIPEGGKAIIKAECLKNSSLFTEDGFKKAWVEAGKRNLISMQDKEKYL